ncbi:R3H-associated N-terminal domain-containing protein [Chaetomidium leptoderma]|uniref:R3H-associated N-terminal domain-containing protein n=1 Tax=Chaetomidium leptoderma TaxID=669021 RepID=A0AAN6VHA6_9PEZI|nr:R3H-associated N-terminal domain-containing protein [Chaetomidium leptoderma]
MAITRTPPGHDEEDSDQHSSHQPQPQPQPTEPSHSLHQHSLSNASTATVDIEAWTVAALESLSIAPIARGTGNALSIPLDADHKVRESSSDENHGSAATAAQMKLRGVAFGGGDAYGTSITPPRRPPSRRDSMRKRDELLKGKEGSRQRRRWENDRLTHVPNVQPPLPSDWQIRPTHRVLPPVPYQLAQYWDRGLREHVEAQRRHRNRNRKGKSNKKAGSVDEAEAAGQAQEEDDEVVGHVPRDLRATAKRTPAVKSWLRVLEQPVRAFVVERGLLAVVAVAATTTTTTTTGEDSGSSSDETDPDDDEIVFVGRNGRMRDGKPFGNHAWKQAQRRRVGGGGGGGDDDGKAAAVERGMVMEMEEEEEGGGGGGGAFKRWLTHSISDYYGLDSKSVMVGNPARRVIYVGVKQKQKQPGPRHQPPSRPVLPPPLWEMF